MKTNLLLTSSLSATFLWLGCSSAQSHDNYVLKEIQSVTYKTVDSKPLLADIYRPEAAETLPAVLVVHGGGWSRRSGDMEWICKNLARAGFVAINITYRLAPEYHFPAPVEDVRDAVAWVRANAQTYRIDPNQIAGWGYSAGANLILLAGLDPAIQLKALVSGGTPADLTAWPQSEDVRKFLGHPYETNPALWKAASPAFNVRKDSPPVFLYHGQWDWIVSIDQFEVMKQALDHQGIPNESYTPDFMGHIWTYYFSQESIDRGLEFLRKRLRKN